ncbi:Uncharacterized protein PECH_002740 [Penicillium ucsense]|uniref:Cryptic loci regulator 2 C-terminal domain-containing protein n=1 Tax=Penicillium ucsense TaxID=2839758 RepID=A0A8J8VY55_9EURO|nr:Uncharacterized protein PECM_000542 [Penicillium ucsense]KAF7730511.1 Uncharacterized protein PECH_002740 [Penicillium ucsense]
MASESETNDDPNRVVIALDHSRSDGNKAVWPMNNSDPRWDYRLRDDESWRIGLAEMWVKKQMPIQEEGKMLMALCRTKAEMEADRLKALGVEQPVKSPRPPPREMIQELPGDVNGPDYWKIHVMDLKKKGTVDEEIDHPFNLDWVLTHDYLKDYFVRLPLQPAFVPRIGEVVLFTYSLEGRLETNTETNVVEMRAEDGRWLGMPEWRAGVVTQVSEEESSFLDIVQETTKQQPISYSGFRVETLPDPLADDKSYSLHYKYVPLKCIKPFGSFERWLWPTPREKLHPSIENAMTTMASYSLLHKVRFKGTWPNARIGCKGIYIGPELLAVADTVRLKPFGLKAEDMESSQGELKSDLEPPLNDVMVIEAIWLELGDCDADPHSEQLARSMVPFIAGKVYTRDPHRLNRVMPFDPAPLEKLTPKEVDDAFQQVGMRVYGRWYRVAAGKTCVVTPGMILGRCYEPEATQLHFGTTDLDYDLHGILSGRRYSVQVDARIPAGLEFFWGDNRVETLGLATMNGIDVGPAADQRDNPLRWQAILRILKGSTSESDYRTADLGITRTGPGPGRPRGARKTYSAVSKNSKLVRTGLGAMTENEDSGEGPSNTADSDPSDMDLSETELMAPIPFREQSEGPEYVP